MNDQQLMELDRLAGEAMDAQKAYWERPFEEITREWIATADEMGFLACPRCDWRILISKFGFIHLGLPGWNGTGNPTSSPCKEHEDVLNEWKNQPNGNKYWNYSEFIKIWNESILNPIGDKVCSTKS